MRERLIAALVGVTVAMIALYGIPRAYMLAQQVETQETLKAERTVDLLAVLVAEREADADPVTADYLADLLHDAEHIVYVAPDGTRVATGDRPVEHERDIVMSRPVAGGGELTLSRSGRLVDRRVSDALLPLVVLGVVLTVVAAGIGFVLARRLSRPFTELARQADQLGHGHFDLVVPHYAIPEAELIGQSLRASAERLEELVRREREFAVNASHQLRTPVTALRLELEDLALWPETPPQVSAQLATSLTELDRLSAAITDQLDLARGHRLSDAADVDLAALAADAVRRWEDALTSRDRRLVRAGDHTVPAHLPPGPLLQVLDVLIENAATHGTGTVTVDVTDAGTHLQVRVADEGRETVGPEVFRRGVGRRTSDGMGVGLAVAAELSEAIGGYLSVDDTPPTRFVLRLPHATAAG